MLCSVFLPKTEGRVSPTACGGQCVAVRPHWWQLSGEKALPHHDSLLSRCLWLPRLLQMYLMRLTPQMRTLQEKCSNSHLYSPLNETDHLPRTEIEAHQPRQPQRRWQQWTVSLKDSLLAKWNTVSQAIVLPCSYARTGLCHRSHFSHHHTWSPCLCKTNVLNSSFSRAYKGSRAFLLPSSTPWPLCSCCPRSTDSLGQERY